MQKYSQFTMTKLEALSYSGTCWLLWNNKIITMTKVFFHWLSTITETSNHAQVRLTFSLQFINPTMFHTCTIASISESKTLHWLLQGIHPSIINSFWIQILPEFKELLITFVFQLLFLLSIFAKENIVSKQRDKVQRMGSLNGIKTTNSS